MKTLILFISILLASFSYGQSTEIRAKIITAEPLDGLGKIVIYSYPDSSLIKGSYLDSADFTLQINAAIDQELYLKVNVPGYMDTSFRFTVTNALMDLGIIKMMKNLELDEVNVTYMKEMFERTMGGVRVNVDGTSLAQLNTLFDVLKASPRLSSPDDESIEIIGKGSPLIMIDRQSIISNDELKAIPANQVDRIEIITNPSAKYKAQGSGGGVIEVYTKNFSLEGFSASIRAAGGVTTQLKPNASANLGFSFKKKKFTLNFYGGGNYRTYQNIGSLTGIATDESQRSYYDTYVNDRSHFWLYYNLKGAYKINDRHQVRAGINGNGSRFSTINTDSVKYFVADTNVTDINSYLDYQSKWRKTMAFINYTWETDTLGSVFEVNLNYMNKSSIQEESNFSGIEDHVGGTSTRFDIQGLSRDNPNVSEIRVNYLHRFDTTGWELNFGGAYSLLFNGQRFVQSDLVNDEWVNDPQYSNSYDYQEDISGLFAEVSRNGDKFGFRLGIRGEYTKLNGYSESLQKKIIDSSYIRPFPNASIQIKPNDKIAITLKYHSGIDRPQFSNYDPFIRVLDSVNIQYGNPYLKPSYINSAGIDLDLFNAYNLSINYTKTDSPVSDLNFIADGGFLSESTPWNADYEEKISVSASIPIRLPWLQGWNSLWVSTSKYVFPEIYDRETFYNTTFGIYSYLTFILPKKFSIMNRLSITKWGSDKMVRNTNFDWGIRITKKFVKADFQIYGEVANIIPTKIVSENFSGNYQTRITGQNSFTTFKLGVFYKFGRLKAPVNVKESTSGQQDRLK
ncbi:MAG: TonB-dependent receptor [Crocinitomicaceae bacterium]|nr:TonB-dependent receptor [Crocinitomicaceae bacterium]